MDFTLLWSIATLRSDSLRFNIFLRRIKSGEWSRSVVEKKIQPIIRPHVSGIRAWRLSAIKSLTYVSAVFAICYVNVLLVYNDIILFAFDMVPIYQVSDQDYQSLWRAHATIVSIAFIGVVFLYDLIADDDTNRFAAQIIVSDTQGIQILSFAVVANGVMALSAVFLPETANSTNQSLSALYDVFRTVIPTLFFLTLFLLLLLFGRISSLLLEEGIGTAVERRGLADISRIANSSTPRESEMEVLQQRISKYPERRYLVGNRGLSIEGDSMDKEGVISDINLKKLNQAFLLAIALDTEVLYAPKLGDEIDQEYYFVLAEDIGWPAHDLFKTILEDAIITSKSTRWEDV